MLRKRIIAHTKINIFIYIFVYKIKNIVLSKLSYGKICISKTVRKIYL